ncbi:MAG: translation elongation factor Ts [Bdellovibrionaceae bacterium]|nr:translation elongation factor Ts [Pseudobdellovibrionaceae bacterium]
MAISASLVKELREKTNAGMMDCKKALEETGGNFEAAVEWLRKKGLASAAKKADRLASEGLVFATNDGKSATLVEVNSETDFVAKNELFQTLIKNIAQTINQSNLTDEMDKALSLKMSHGPTVEEAIKEGIAKIGENLVFRRFVHWTSQGLLETYIHGDGKIGVLVELDTTSTQPTVKELAKDLCLHIAAMNPLSLSAADMPQEIINKEKEILKAKNLEQGKKPEMVDKIVEGQIRKFLSESCLLEQAFVKNPDLKVQDHIQAVAKAAGTGITLKRFKRFELGEGLEKKVNNFAEEVAAQAGLH